MTSLVSRSRAAGMSLIACAALLGVLEATAQGLELEEIRSRVRPGAVRLIEVKKDCQAYSTIANDWRNYLTIWDGPCQEGLAHGVGYQRVYAAGRLLVVSRGRHEKGRWIAQQGYTLSLGQIISIKHDLATGHVTREAVLPEEVKEWASDIVQELPRAQASWDELMALRMEQISRFNEAEANAPAKNSTPERSSSILDLFRR